ncbi:MAG TPA: hypothetical protein VG672_09195, partial [Bryobacteraceae bacterium]|nr:hypothetical protein [Bryobacteraceae bacterium]
MTEVDSGQAIGLDVGTSRVVVARGRDKQYTYESQLNAFVTVPYSRLTAALMARESVFHTVQGSEILIAGNDAQKFAEVFHVELRRPMVDGILNPREPHSLAVVRQLITRLVGRSGREGQRLAFSVPAPTIGIETALAYHEACLHQVLIDLGYQPTSLSEGLAVIFGELPSSSYTGVAMSFGSGLSNVCLAVLSLPVISFSVPKAGDFIDSHAALATGELATRLRVEKEQSFQINGFSENRVHNALTVYYDEVMRSAVEGLIQACSRSLPKLDQAVPVVLSGGSTMPGGFLGRFNK